MEIGIGLPSTIPGTNAPDVLAWARAAERAGFSTLGTLDRVVFDNYDPIPVLAAVAAVTERIRLTTSVLIAPCRGNGTILAKQLASVDRISGGRLTVGIAVGTRKDDYQATGLAYETRGQAQDELLERMHALWTGQADLAGAVGPAPTREGGPPLLIGGAGKPTVRRVVEYGSGWISGGGDPQTFAGTAASVRAAWNEAGRAGTPRLVALGYFALGSRGTAAATSYLGDYYGFSGEYATQVIAGAITSPAQLQEALGGFSDAGCDELILFPCLPDLDQVEQLAATAADLLRAVDSP
jgi:alkanesulfonate monooxygenase SsuD/methylene tetrahydromethanopterin reductase-like flavin-dependent oxidoreductase (luciferase family)